MKDDQPWLTDAMHRARPDLDDATIERVGGADLQTTRIRRDGLVIGYAAFEYNATASTASSYYDMVGFWPSLAEFCAVYREAMPDSDKVAFGCP